MDYISGAVPQLDYFRLDARTEKMNAWIIVFVIVVSLIIGWFIGFSFGAYAGRYTVVKQISETTDVIPVYVDGQWHLLEKPKMESDNG